MSGAVDLFKQSDFHLLDILVLDTFIVVPILNANGRDVAHNQVFRNVVILSTRVLSLKRYLFSGIRSRFSDDILKIVASMSDVFLDFQSESVAVGDVVQFDSDCFEFMSLILITCRSVPRFALRQYLQLLS